MEDNPSDSTPRRKKEHLELCLTDKVAFRNKTTGFEKYDFVHYAITETDLNKIDFRTKFFKKEIAYPFLISCMTGGTSEAENINAQLAVAASELKVPLGVGSQRQALENKEYLSSYKVIRQKASGIPVLGNLGAAQVSLMKSADDIKYLAELIEADAFVIHVNPVQELVQKKGEPHFKGLLKSIEKICRKIDIPVIVKEVGAGISRQAAADLINAGVKGIDIAGAGGTSWSGVEILRNSLKADPVNQQSGKEKAAQENYFWDWGLPTAYCIRTVAKLKKKHDFLLIGSGGINNATDAAKALALGADLVASARIILQTLDKSGTEGVVEMISNWFDHIRKIMFLTGAQTITAFQKNRIIKSEEMW